MNRRKNGALAALAALAALTAFSWIIAPLTVFNGKNSDVNGVQPEKQRR